MMYVKAEYYSINLHGESVAHVMLKVNPFNLKLKAKIELINGVKIEMKSTSLEQQQGFQKRVYDEVMKRINK